MTSHKTNIFTDFVRHQSKNFLNKCMSHRQTSRSAAYMKCEPLLTCHQVRCWTSKQRIFKLFFSMPIYSDMHTQNRHSMLL